MQLISSFNGENLYQVCNYDDYLELSKDTTWSMSKDEFDDEKDMFFVVINNNKKIGIRLKHYIFFNEKNFLIEGENVMVRKNKEGFLKFVKEKKLLDFYKNSIDYDSILKDSIKIIYDKEHYDINVIIPIRGRFDFLKTLYSHLLKSINNTNKKITITVAEHSQNPGASLFCKKNKINYIWVDSKKDELFNKCLMMNLGAFFGPKSKYFLFHDVDCIMQSNFFDNIFENINTKNNVRAIQCFHGRRVLYLNENLTDSLIKGEIQIDDLNINTNGVSLPSVIGAPGGSVMIEKNLFFDVGGYDADLFQANSPEDIFFWKKIEVYTKFETSDNPKIELFHMNHPVTYNSNPKLKLMLLLFNIFETMNVEEKKEYIKYKNEKIVKYSYE